MPGYSESFSEYALKMLELSKSMVDQVLQDDQISSDAKLKFFEKNASHFQEFTRVYELTKNDNAVVTGIELVNQVFGGTENMSVEKLYRLASKKRVPALKIDGRWFFPLKEFIDWIKAESKVENTAQVIEHYGRLRVVNE